MGREVKIYPGFRDDLRRWYRADTSLGETLLKYCYAIQENPLKGEPKRGGPIAGCRAVYARNTNYAIIYKNEPDVMLPSQTSEIDCVHFYGIKKHDNQDRARSGTEEPLISMYQFELEVPPEKAAEIHSALHDAEGVYPNDSKTEWGNTAIFRGEYEGQHENLFNAIASDGEVLERERRPLEEFLEDP
jgi:hypothetical protein